MNSPIFWASLLGASGAASVLVVCPILPFLDLVEESWQELRSIQIEGARQSFPGPPRGSESPVRSNAQNARGAVEYARLIMNLDVRSSITLPLNAPRFVFTDSNPNEYRKKPQ